MNKKLLAAVLASTCVVSMAVPAAAADAEVTGVGSYEVAVTAEVNKPTLNVTLPTATSVLVNPYRLPVDVSADQDKSEMSYDTVITVPMKVSNLSSCAITVGVKGSFTTKTVVAGFDASDSDTYSVKITVDSDGVVTSSVTTNEADTVVTNSTSADEFYVLKDGKTIVDKDGYQLTGSYAAEKIANPDDPAKKKVTAATLKVTAYTASKNIKVATADLKDPDTEKTNSIFMFVEGSSDGTWAEKYDATVAKNAASATNPTSMMVLGAKETSQKVLYVGGSADGTTAEEGYVRITGSAATAPTTPWADIADVLETPFAFVIDAVANKAPKTPTVSNVSATTDGAGTATIAATTGKTNEWDVAFTGTAKNDNFTFGLVDLDPADAVLSFTGTGDFTAVNASTGELAQTSNLGTGLSGDIVITATSMGKTATFTLHVTIGA